MLAVQVQYFNYLESQRHNLATEHEMARHDVISERQGQESLQQGWENLRISDFNSITQRRSQEEQARHNEASETISIASLNETIRHNQAQEAIGRTQAEASMLGAQASMQSAKASTLSAQASMTSAQASMKNAQLNETKWNTSGYYLEQTERNKNLAQTSYYESQTTTGMMGAIGRLASAGSSLLGVFLK